MRETIRRMAAIQAAAITIEDQVFPKRCGHRDGKELVPAEEFAEKIAEMVAARRNPDFMIIARTDARHVTGIEDAIDRANRYRAAGAEGHAPAARAARPTGGARAAPALRGALRRRGVGPAAMGATI